MRSKIAELKRFIATPKVAKHRVFVWLHSSVLPDNLVIAIARDDDTTFGICHSLHHEIWSVRQAFFIGVGNDPTYTPTSTFLTFPFPDGLTPNVPTEHYKADPRAKRIASAASKLNALRGAWLNPPDMVKPMPEVVPGYPDRLLAVSVAAEVTLNERTLTKLYNDRPTWLALAHRDLDRAVANAYGWSENLADRAQPENAVVSDREAAEAEILRLLFELNQKRATENR